MAMASPCLNTCTVQQPRATLSRIHILLHFSAILGLLYYRIKHLLQKDVSIISWSLITIAELIFTFIWLITQSFRWRPVARSVEPENLPADKELPSVDVFICTADPIKEPVVEVINTVLSAMSLDYPPEKLAVYLSDDGGAAVTLYAIKEACAFARVWVPFCRKYGIKTICPEAFFSSFGDDERLNMRGNEFKNEEETIKAAYEVLKKNVEKSSSVEGSVTMDRPPYVEVIHDNMKNERFEDKQSKLPLLVYMSRERRPSRPHRFKAGALNALLRVSGVMSNAPYMLVLDCDMYCNDPSSAKQAMCFHLDQNISPTLSYVQFPQTFYNVSKNDIYDAQSRSAYKNKYQGMDGVGGTVCAGTGYYLKKEALYDSPNNQNMTPLFLKAQSEYKWESLMFQSEELLQEAEEKFGASRKFINSINSFNDQRKGREILSNEIIDEAKTLASCTFEENTSWGEEIGYSYNSLLESSYTGYLLHSKGWKSVYLYPKRPCFLGCSTIDMKDALVQLMKWASGLVQVGLSKYSPLTYGMSRMPLVQSMCYAYFMFSHFLSIPCFLYGIVPPLCFLTGTSVFPKMTSTWFALFTTIFLSSLAEHLYEVLSSGGNLRTWWNEQRIWIIKTVTACLFGCLDVLMKWLGVAKANFRLTNKAIDEEKLRKYEKGKFDFQGAKLFMVPLTFLVMFNLVCFTFGMKRMVSEGNFEEMFGQGFLSFYVLVLSYPILEGLVSKKAK
ncbi:quillaic acid 3-O-glycosyltransferase CSL1-like [Nicotiana tabacum]|uniref:Cellulose synthase-like protein G3 n=1 Tax=Nicotiana tabacum TaxID=4097 RepID=A0A1S4BT79_TOBAC|nr:PREDICTED: cellulose synthase-like protein G3 [Nicotiana tabacum]